MEFILIFIPEYSVNCYARYMLLSHELRHMWRKLSFRGENVDHSGLREAMLCTVWTQLCFATPAHWCMYLLNYLKRYIQFGHNISQFFSIRFIHFWFELHSKAIDPSESCGLSLYQLYRLMQSDHVCQCLEIEEIRKCGCANNNQRPNRQCCNLIIECHRVMS